MSILAKKDIGKSAMPFPRWAWWQGKNKFQGAKVSGDTLVIGDVFQDVNWALVAVMFQECQWKRISHKHNTRWKSLSLLKVNAFFSLQKIVVKKHNNFIREIDNAI
jgi:hypothetical protein